MAVGEWVSMNAKTLREAEEKLISIGYSIGSQNRFSKTRELSTLTLQIRRYGRKIQVRILSEITDV